MDNTTMLCTPYLESEMEDYRKKLAVFQQTRRKERKHYEEKVRRMLAKPLQEYQIDDLFDPLTGGVTFQDDEWELIDEDDPLKALFKEADEQECYKYMLPLDGKILLRGADVYYFFSCYLSRYRDPSHKQFEIWFENVILFLTKVTNAIHLYNFHGMNSRRLLLGVLDNLRNIALILATADMLCAQERNKVLFESMDTVWIKHIKVCHELMCEICFCNFEPEYLISKVGILITAAREDIPPIQEIISKTDDGYLLLKSVNPWREADNFIENLVGMMYVADQMHEHDRIRLIGLLCGGLELPLLLERLLRADVSVSFLFQRTGLYTEKITAFNNSPSVTLIKRTDNDILNVIVDENAQSGISAHLAIRQLDDIGIPVHKLALLRGPSIARLEQLRNSGMAINLACFDNSILGALYVSPYTRLKKDTNYGGMFLDELRLFSYGAEAFLKALYRNNTFIRDSEVDIFMGFSIGKDASGYEE